ncbi:M56 family metallopeptidase [Streptomyces violaceorubidus]
MRALFAHERAHLAAGRHRFVLAVRLAALANPFLRPLRTAVSYTAERWADEAAATGGR